MPSGIERTHFGDAQELNLDSAPTCCDNALMLSIDITETLLPYSEEDYTRWCNKDWWLSGQCKTLLPESEWDRIESKFRKQATGPPGPGNHFAETLQMRALEAEGLKWQYEDASFFDSDFFDWDFFRPPFGRARAKGHPNVYTLMVEAFGEDKLQCIKELADEFRAATGVSVKKADLFAYRQDGCRVIPVRFVECKFKDPVTEGQLLALALMADVLNIPVQLVRYVEPNRMSRGGDRYQRKF